MVETRPCCRAPLRDGRGKAWKHLCIPQILDLSACRKTYVASENVAGEAI
jgi:hypothetical protein